MSQSNVQARVGGNNSRSCYRWERNEDQALIDSMIELVDDGGWKVDNGQFRHGAYAKLEKLMEEKIPGCRMKAKPHIESRVKLLRNQYNAIAEMLGPNASGFGWDDKLSLVTCAKEVWDEWIKSHKNAVGLRNKPFPFYDELDKIFGKDRATGEYAQSVDDVVEELDKDEEQHTPYVDLEENADMASQSLGSDNYVEPSSKTSSDDRNKKRARVDNAEILQAFSARMDKMGKMMEAAGEHIGNLAKCFQHESDSAERRMQVTSEVMKTPGITPPQVLTVAKKIALNPLEVDFFFSLPEDYRQAYVESLLLGD